MSTWNPNAASLVVDLRHLRCGQCKVRLDDRFAESCPICGAVFDRVVSNDVGLADRLIQERRQHRSEITMRSQPVAANATAASQQREAVLV